MFTILIPNYNGEEFVARCIRSALDQTHANIEVVVVDGKSTDSSHAIIDALATADSRVRRVSEPVDTGLSDAVNIGIKNARGDYVLWLGNDDYIIDGRVLADVDVYLDECEARTGIAPVLCYGGYKIHWTEADVFEGRKKRDLDYRMMWFTDAIMCGNVFFDPTFCLRNQIQLDESLRYCMDYDLWLKVIDRLTSRKQVVCIPNRLIHVFTMRKDNITGGNVYASSKEAMGVALRNTRNPLKVAGIYGFTGFQLGFQRARSAYLGLRASRLEAS